VYWLTICGMAAVTYAMRAIPLLAGGGRFPAWLARGLAYVPVALFAALAVPGFVRPHSTLTLGPEAAAGAVAALVGRRTGGKTVPVLAAGLATYALARLLLR